MAQLPLDARPEEMMQVASKLQTLISEIETEKGALDTLITVEFPERNEGTVSKALADIYNANISTKLANQITTLTTSKNVLESSAERLEEAETTTTSGFNQGI